ncbi:MAG TPA: hypothetical protein DCF99_11895 [Flavobacteriaceae bacterium]|nr:hypothetical protein [Flavobacteriaceae bacterium]
MNLDMKEIRAENLTEKERRIFVDKALKNLGKFLFVVGISVGCAFMTYTVGYIHGFTSSLQITNNIARII